MAEINSKMKLYANDTEKGVELEFNAKVDKVDIGVILMLLSKIFLK